MFGRCTARNLLCYLRSFLFRVPYAIASLGTNPQRDHLLASLSSKRKNLEDLEKKGAAQIGSHVRTAARHDESSTRI